MNTKNNWTEEIEKELGDCESNRYFWFKKIEKIIEARDNQWKENLTTWIKQNSDYGDFMGHFYTKTDTNRLLEHISSIKHL